MIDQLTPTVTKQRVVRVFISSTFRDMQEERDMLIKKVFPKLRRRCRERGVEFVEVDLRWGVTEEQTERGEVLPICLAEEAYRLATDHGLTALARQIEGIVNWVRSRLDSMPPTGM